MTEPEDKELNRMDSTFRGDCTGCAALCCVALSFDQSSLFAKNKKASVACENLSRCGTCILHDDLEDSGYSGCVQYDCLGAGQRVTQEVFKGQSWQSNSDLLLPMMDAFRVMRKIQEYRQLLHMAGQFDLSGNDEQNRIKWDQILNPTEGWAYGTLLQFEKSLFEQNIKNFLSSLHGYVLTGNDTAGPSSPAKIESDWSGLKQA